MSSEKLDNSREDKRSTRRRFTLEFKQQAVRLITEEKYSFKAAAKVLGVGEQSLRHWHAELAAPPEPCGENASEAELRAEKQRLLKELRRVKMECEILEKANAYLAKKSR